MKTSELLTIINTLPKECDPDIVMGEAWLPERLDRVYLEDDLLFMQFDNAPLELQEEEGRGFVEHEVELIRSRLNQLLSGGSDHEATLNAILGLFLLGHELSSSQVIEMLENDD